MPEVAEYLGSGPVVDYIEGWLRTPLDELQMWSYYPLLLCSPSESDSPGGWHRVRGPLSPPSHPLPAAPLRPAGHHPTPTVAIASVRPQSNPARLEPSPQLITANAPTNAPQRT